MQMVCVSMKDSIGYDLRIRDAEILQLGRDTRHNDLKLLSLNCRKEGENLHETQSDAAPHWAA